MNKARLARLARHRKVQQTLDTYASAVAAVPAFALLATQFRQKLGLLTGTSTKKPTTSQGATQSKNMAGTALIARLVKAANALYLLYKSEGNLEEAAKMHRNPTDYRNLSELVLATEALDLSRRVSARADDLKNYNILGPDVATLATDAAAFDHLLESPQLAIDASKIKGATAASVLRDLNLFLKDDLRAGIELLKGTQDDAYRALREASQVDDKGSRKGKKGSQGQQPAGVNVNAAMAARYADSLKAGPDLETLLAGASALPAAALAGAADGPYPLALTCPDGTEVSVYGTTTPNGTVSKRIGVRGSGAGLASAYQRVATSPCQIFYTFKFSTRPWSLSFGAAAGAATQDYTLDNVAAGCPTQAIGSPDTFELVLTVHA